MRCCFGKKEKRKTSSVTPREDKPEELLQRINALESKFRGNSSRILTSELAKTTEINNINDFRLNEGLFFNIYKGADSSEHTTKGMCLFDMLTNREVSMKHKGYIYIEEKAEIEALKKEYEKISTDFEEAKRKSNLKKN